MPQVSWSTHLSTSHYTQLGNPHTVHAVQPATSQLRYRLCQSPVQALVSCSPSGWLHRSSEHHPQHTRAAVRAFSQAEPVAVAAADPDSAGSVFEQCRSSRNVLESTCQGTEEHRQHYIQTNNLQETEQQSPQEVQQHSLEGPEQQSQQQPKEQQGSKGKQPRIQQYSTVYSIHQQHNQDPCPVQLPPPGCTNDLPLAKHRLLNYKYLPPRFLQQYPAADGAYNYISFIGPMDAHGGKYLVPRHALDDFMQSYFKFAHYKSRRMFLAETYQQGEAYRYFQELDFAWDLDTQLVLDLIPNVIKIVKEETCRVHKVVAPLPEPIISMRTAYKVHLNFHGIFTVETIARSVRKAVINRCRVELSGLPPLELLKEEQQLQQQLVEAQEMLIKLQDVAQQVGQVGQHTQHLLAGLQADTAQQQQQPALQQVGRTARGIAMGPSHVQRQQQQQAEVVQQAEQQQAQQHHQTQRHGLSQLHGTSFSTAGTSAAIQHTAVESADADKECSSASQQRIDPAAVAAAQAATDGASSSQLAHLDWESIVDSPHGSFRLLGSCKAPWMDSDPAWVVEKCYSRVQLAQGVWMRQPLTYADLLQCSILLRPMELRVYEQSDDFLAAAYQTAQTREQLLAAKRTIRAATREMQRLEMLQKTGNNGLTRSDGKSLQPTAAQQSGQQPRNTEQRIWQQQASLQQQQQHNKQPQDLQQPQQQQEQMRHHRKAMRQRRYEPQHRQRPRINQEQELANKQQVALARLQAAAAAEAFQKHTQSHIDAAVLVKPDTGLVRPNLQRPAPAPQPVAPALRQTHQQHGQQ